ncbi:MutS-related protein [Dokdonia sp. Asnod1-B02]|uniref:MutS-related protein n=1 Tax=Dokdonia sp. Asnod1-B02 TaxID=3160573 RepID=UPI00386C864D
MTAPTAFYEGQIKTYQKELSEIKRKLNISSTIRLVVFLATGASVYFTLGNTQLLMGCIIAGIIAFLLLVSRHSQLQHKRDLTKALLERNETELKVLNRDFYDLPDGSEFHNPEHVFSQDIDLFGRGSFFQYFNRTALDSGSSKLASMLLSNDIEAISQKQEAVKELGELPEWRQLFSAIASLVTTDISADSVLVWLKEYTSFVPKHMKLISRIFSAISLLTLGAYFIGFIAGWWVFVVFGIGLLISGRFFGRINMLSAHTGKIQTTFTQYASLLSRIEEQEFASDLLVIKRKMVITSEQSSSSILRAFSKHLDALDQRNNFIIGLISNGFFLRDLSIVHNIEGWIATHRDAVEDWFEVIAFFDAYNSLGNYAFNHQAHVFPEITETGTTLVTTGAAHPLLDPTTAVRNDITIKNDEFFIITGANMAGKSTFLRTVALQIVMGNVGLPIFATSASYTPIKLITSMRTTDSLTDDESYFFSELKRLKFIVDQIETDRYFIILDEILKGTNSTDKAEGSRKFIDKLVGAGATGIIATHDLSLCEAANDLKEVKNYYFDAQIINDELFFDYTFKEGICQNMNASFLLKKMGIVS